MIGLGLDPDLSHESSSVWNHFFPVIQESRGAESSTTSMMPPEKKFCLIFVHDVMQWEG